MLILAAFLSPASLECRRCCQDPAFGKSEFRSSGKGLERHVLGRRLACRQGFICIHNRQLLVAVAASGQPSQVGGQSTLKKGLCEPRTEQPRRLAALILTIVGWLCGLQRTHRRVVQSPQNRARQGHLTMLLRRQLGVRAIIR